MTSPNDILFGGGKPSAKFNGLGVTVAGTITELGASQQTDFRTQELLAWPDGSPKMQVLVDVQTADRDATRPFDDGIRRIYVKGKSMTDAVKEAVKSSGARGLEIGGVLSVTYTGDGAAQKGMSPPKLYAAEYRRPDPAAAANVVLSPQPAPAPVAAPVAAPAPVATPAPPVAAPSGGPDLSSLSPEARAVVEQMLAKQAG